ncbi:iron-sulfur cluster assembly accessory protein [Balneolaceae bacterium ANBcel3]|nr:iron-sulfur cluster assembly accessory protein [Balneolaceae bacterium ANBcel3]
MNVPETTALLTERAAQQVKNIIKEEKVESDKVLRIAVKGGGCSGLSYELGFDVPTTADQMFESHGVKIAIDKRHLLYLEGLSVDFRDGLDARGFMFENPNATSTCGCGTSFSA